MVLLTYPEVMLLLIERRKALRLSQRALAELINLSQPQISLYETGRRSAVPRSDVLARWAAALGLRLKVFVAYGQLDFWVIWLDGGPPGAKISWHAGDVLATPVESSTAS